MKKSEFKIGDKVKHRFRSNYQQRGVVIEIEEGCNGRIKVLFEDGSLKPNEESYLCPIDLARTEKKEVLEEIFNNDPQNILDISKDKTFRMVFMGSRHGTDTIAREYETILAKDEAEATHIIELKYATVKNLRVTEVK